MQGGNYNWSQGAVPLYYTIERSVRSSHFHRLAVVALGWRHAGHCGSEQPSTTAEGKKQLRRKFRDRRVASSTEGE